MQSQLNELGRYTQGQASTQSREPRELTIIEQTCGLSNGLYELHRRLIILASRISGTPQPGNTPEAHPEPSGLPSLLAEAHSELRSCSEIVSALDRIF
jgi:hypothetical protein